MLLKILKSLCVFFSQTFVIMTMLLLMNIIAIGNDKIINQRLDKLEQQIKEISHEKNN